MKYLCLLILFFCAACSTTGPQPLEAPRPPLLVYKDQYVVEAKGPWCPWRPGVVGCPKVLGAGVWSVTEDADVKLITKPGISTDSADVIEYSSDDDLCASDELEGRDCSPNYVLSIDGVPNDTLYPKLWGMDKISGPAAWDLHTGNSGVVVAVIDTGINPDHPDLKDNITGAHDATGQNNPSDDNGHGTHVAGTVCAVGNNSRGVVGVAHKCSILSVKFLGANGNGSLYDAIKAIDYAVQKGARVINASWGGGGFSPPLRNAIQRAADAGVLFVAAAGNSGVNTDENPHYPSAYNLENIISVAATGKTDTLTGFSNYGVESVDVAAPGSGIWSTWHDGLFNSISGTSMAAPHVSGAAALLYSKYPNIQLDAAKGKILAGVNKTSSLSGRVSTGGRLNALKALQEEVPAPPTCDQAELKRCRLDCSIGYECQYHRQRLCRKDCKKAHCNV